MKFFFTLVELLVVIAILAILTAFLLPALGKAKCQIRKIDCFSKLRQSHIAIIGYTNDADGRLPIPFTSYTDNWMMNTAAYFGYPTPSAITDADAALIEKFLKKPQGCPSALLAITYNYSCRTYAMNAEPNFSVSKIESFKTPSMMMIAGDGVWYPPGHYFGANFKVGFCFDPNYQWIAHTENTGLNFIFLDGHTEQYRYADIPTGVTGAGATFWRGN